MSDFIQDVIGYKLAAFTAIVVLLAGAYLISPESFGFTTFAASPSQMIIKSLDIGTEYDSNHPLYQKEYILINAQVGQGGESVHAYATVTPQQVESQEDVRMQRAFTIEAQILSQSCGYGIGQSNVKPELNTYIATTANCPSPWAGIACFPSELVAECTKQLGTSTLVKTIPVDLNSYGIPIPNPTYDRAICIMKTRVADFGQVGDPTAQVTTQFSVDNGIKRYTGVVDNTAQTRINLPDTGEAKAVIDLVGLTSMGSYCPSTQGISAFNFEGAWFLANERTINLYDNAEDTAVAYINSLNSANTPSSISVNTINNQLGSIMNPVLTSITTLQGVDGIWQTVSIPPGSNYATVSASEPIYFSEIVMKLDAQYATIYHPVSDLKLGTVKSDPFIENAIGKISVAVNNADSVAGTGNVFVDTCTSGFTKDTTAHPVTVAAGSTKWVEFNIRGNAMSGSCSVCLVDDLDRECKSVTVSTTSFRECDSGQERCLGISTPQVCVNRMWTDKTTCTGDDICSIGAGGAICKAVSDMSCNEVCKKKGYASGTCESILDAQTHHAWVEGKKNFGRTADCGLLLPPENCLCDPVPWGIPFAWMLVAGLFFFGIGYYYYEGEPDDERKKNAMIIAAVAMMIPLLLQYANVELPPLEEHAIGFANSLVPEPWVPSNTTAILVMGVAGALWFGLTTFNPMFAVAGFIAGGFVGYMTKTMLLIIQPYAAVVGGIIGTYFSMQLLTNVEDERMRYFFAALMGLLTALIIYVSFFLGVILTTAYIILKFGIIDKFDFVTAELKKRRK